MKRLPLTLFLLSLVVFTTSTSTEAQERRAAPKKAAASSVGLIDMAHVFQNYDKFKEMQEGLKSAVLQSDSEAKKMAEDFKSLQEKLSEQSKQYDPGSAEYEQIERRLLDEKGKFESWRQSRQRVLARRETEMLKEVYGDVSRMVKAYAEYAEYTLVLRFNSKGVENEMQPQQAIQAMNKNVIYHQTGNDITGPVLRKLNSEYKKSAGTRTRTVGERKTIK